MCLARVSLIDFVNTILSYVEPNFEFDDDNKAAKEIVDKIMQLPLGDRLWPNCLGRTIRNSSVVNVEEYANRLGMVVESDDDQSRSATVRTVAQRTRSKAVVSVAKGSRSVQGLSSSSSDSLKTELGLEVSSERVFAKGIHKLFSALSFFVLFMSLSIILLLLFEPLNLVVEFKPPMLKPFEGSSKELFAKRGREEKPKNLDYSKSPLSIASDFSPEQKRPRPSSSNVVVAPPAFSASKLSQVYDPEAKPSEFVHLLDDLLLSQYVDSSSAKSTDTIVGEVVGQAFHVCLFPFAFVLFTFFLFMSNHLILTGAASFSHGAAGSQGSIIQVVCSGGSSWLVCSKVEECARVCCG